LARFDHIFIAPKDWDSSFKFYHEILGWRVVSSWGEGSQERGAVLKSAEGMTVVIAEEHADMGDNAWISGFNGHRPTIHLNVPSVDNFYSELIDKNSVVIKPEDIHWGGRWTVLKDPDDNLIAFNQPPKTP
jgi:catechol 2,3-dioxygenase-like lactoylglutathione lyase family enzyme